MAGQSLQGGARALCDLDWAEDTRTRLSLDAARLDRMMVGHGQKQAQGSDLFRLYHLQKPDEFQRKLAENHIWSRIFPYSDHFLRLGLPGTESAWVRLENILEGM